jgi:hypothetical protein
VLAIAHNCLGKPEEAINDVDRAMRLSRRDPLVGIFYCVKGWSLFMWHRHDRAVDWRRRRSVAALPELPFPFLWLIAGLEETGRDAEAGLSVLSRAEGRAQDHHASEGMAGPCVALERSQCSGYGACSVQRPRYQEETNESLFL